MRSLTGFLTAASLSLLLGACADSTGPRPSTDAAGPMRAGTMSALRKGTQTTSTATTTTPPTTLTPLRFAAWAPPLQTYDTTFVVTQGTAASDTLYFQKGKLGLRMPYMVLIVPADAQFVDAYGNPLPNGSTVNLTVHADSVFTQINFGPHGSTFGKDPATVKISWLYTDLLGKSGADLRLWYQPDVNTPWNPLATQVDLKLYWLVSTLDHFSNYAVAY